MEGKDSAGVRGKIDLSANRKPIGMPCMEQLFKAVLNLVIGIAILGFFIAFCMWFFRPIDGYFKPNFNEDGSVGSLYYVRTTWWGLDRDTYVVKYSKMGHAYYEVEDREVMIEDWKYSEHY